MIWGYPYLSKSPCVPWFADSWDDPPFCHQPMAPQSDRKCLADLASGERRERFGAGSIYIPYSIKSQLELQSEFPNHMIAIDSHCASVKKKTVAIQVTMELFFLLTETLLALWYVPKKFISLFSVQGASAASGSSTRPKRKCLWLCTENIH